MCGFQCVHNMRDVSYTELILKSYASIPDASLGNLIKAVKQIDRMDAFVALQKNLEGKNYHHDWLEPTFRPEYWLSRGVCSKTIRVKEVVAMQTSQDPKYRIAIDKSRVVLTEKKL